MGNRKNMNAEFLAILEYWEKEKGISRNVLLSAVEEALLSAAKKAVGPARELRVAIDPKSGDIRSFPSTTRFRFLRRAA
jgi:N utilization substance protein A